MNSSSLMPFVSYHHKTEKVRMKRLQLNTPYIMLIRDIAAQSKIRPSAKVTYPSTYQPLQILGSQATASLDLIGPSPASL